MAPLYTYQARNKEGERLRGTLEADCPGQIVKQLKKEGFFLTSLEKKRGKKPGRVLPLRWRANKRTLAFFSQQFSVLVKAGITVLDSLAVLGRQINHPRLKEALSGIQDNIAAGLSLYQSLARYPEVFPELYCQMIKAGERGGALDRVLDRLAAYYERQYEINSKIKTALYYPAVVMTAAVLVIAFLLTEVIPSFVVTFASLEAALPLPTRLVIKISSGINTYWWAFISIIFAILIIFKSLKKSPAAAYRLDRLKLKVPLLGEILQKIYISRFSSSLSLLLVNGVDLLSALKTVEDLIGSRVYARLITTVRAQVREGMVLSHPLAAAAEFPDLVVQMIKVGEESGSLEVMLDKVSAIYDRELEVDIDGLVSLVEPVVLVILALIIGLIVIAVAMPIFEMVEYF